MPFTNKTSPGLDVHRISKQTIKKRPKAKIGDISQIKRIAKKYAQQAVGQQCEFSFTGLTRFWDIVNFVGDTAICDALSYAITPPDSCPGVTVSSPQWGTREIGNAPGNVTVNANITIGTNPLGTITFQRRIGAWAFVTINWPVPAVVGVNSYVDTGVTENDETIQYRAIVTDNDSCSIVSNTVSINFANRWYRGFNPTNGMLTESQIETGLTGGGSVLNNTRIGTLMNFSIATPGNFKFIAYPASMGNVVDPTGDIVDNATNLAVPSTLAGTVNVTNAFGYVQLFNVYKSVNIIGGTQILKMLT